MISIAPCIVVVQLITGITFPNVYHRGVTWDYNNPLILPIVAFDVETSTNLQDWNLILTTNQPPAYWDSMNATEFVRVGAHWINVP